MKSKIFYFIAMGISIFLLLDILGSFIKYIGKDISYYKNLPEVESFIGLTFRTQSILVVVSSILLAIGIVFSLKEDKELLNS